MFKYNDEDFDEGTILLKLIINQYLNDKKKNSKSN